MRSASRLSSAPSTVNPPSSPPPVPAPLVLRSRVAFVLYALAMISALSTITALIERAAT